MSRVGYSEWRKLDNAALAFPAAAGSGDTRVFRFYSQLKEEIDQEALQTALDLTMERYPLFRAVLRKGLFWYYLEQRDIRALVKEEDRPPCSKIFIPDKKSLLFEVSFYKNRINLEVFHALTDGTGAMYFLVELTRNYLKTAYPQADLPPLPHIEEVTGKDQEEDSFFQYYSADALKDAPKDTQKKEPAYQFHGERLMQDEMHIMEVTIPVKETLAKARAHGVSITVLFTAMILCAIHEEIPKSRMNRPIALMIPVNLRNYFPSQSMTNFFGWIEVGHKFSDGDTFSDVIQDVKEQFQKELDKERIGMRMSALVKLERNPLLRAVPLELKQIFLRIGTNFGGRTITAVFSNVGVIKLPPQYGEYIEQFGIFTSTDSMQLCSCSYGERMVLGFTSKIPSENIQRNFLKILETEEIPHEEAENDFPGYKKKPKFTGKKFFQIFTFACLMAAVICLMTNYMVSKEIGWAWFATAGCFCTWLLATVAYKKRRNILKNESWQLVLFSVLGIVWDICTGWYGWSIDFLFPTATLAVLASMPIIAKICHLEVKEYLYYMIQSCSIGMIPIILVLVKLVKLPYPSIICSGCSFLVLAGLFIFKGKETIREIYKKLRL
jgi:NRPS condensation-like uncharacterized protein